MDPKDVFWSVAPKWALINSGGSFVVGIFTMLIMKLTDNTIVKMVAILMALMVLFFAPYCLYKAYKEYETKTKQHLYAANAWRIAAVFFLIAAFFSMFSTAMGIGGSEASLGRSFRTSEILSTVGYQTLVLAVLYMIWVTILASWWLFEKAGKPGWASFTPIYNLVCMAEIGKKPGWWIAMMFIPLVGIVFGIMLLNAMIKAFGKDSGYTFGIIFLPFIFYPMLGFGDAKWIHDTKFKELDIMEHLVE